MTNDSAERNVEASDLTEAETHVRDILEGKLADVGRGKVAIVEGSDHDGDAVIFVDVRHDPTDGKPDFQAIFAAEREAREAAWAAREYRFLHFRHKFGADDEPTPAA